MPPIFKALASIMAWILWISALVCGFSTLAIGIISGRLYSSTEVVPMIYPAFFAVTVFFGIAAVVIMLLRKKME